MLNNPTIALTCKQSTEMHFIRCKMQSSMIVDLYNATENANKALCPYALQELQSIADVELMLKFPTSNDRQTRH